MSASLSSRRDGGGMAWGPNFSQLINHIFLNWHRFCIQLDGNWILRVHGRAGCTRQPEEGSCGRSLAWCARAATDAWEGAARDDGRSWDSVQYGPQYRELKHDTHQSCFMAEAPPLNCRSGIASLQSFTVTPRSVLH